MNWVDWTIVIVLAVSAIGGLLQGFFRTACSLIGLVCGLSVAAWNYPRVAAFLMPVVRIEAIADTIAFFLIAIVIVAIFHLIGSLLGRAFSWIGLGCLDRIGGGVVGVLEGAVVVTLALFICVAFFPKSPWLTQSQLAKQFLGALNVSTEITPNDLAQKLRQGLRLLEQESPTWIHPGNHST